MFIGRNKIEIINKKDNIKCEVTYKKPEILMLDCDKEESDRLKEKGFNIELGTFGKRYKITDQYGNKKVALNNKTGNIIEKDIVIIDMKQRDTNEEYNLENLENLEDGTYITTHERQKEFNPINISSKLCVEEFRKLRNKDSIVIIFADGEVKESYNITTWKNRHYSIQYATISNYDFLPFNINPSESHFETQKFNIVAEGIFKDIFKNYKGKIYSRCTFYINNYENKNTEKLLENIYGDLIGYFQLFEDKNGIRNTLIVLPQCENKSLIIENILMEILPLFYPEMLKDFVKDTWMDKEEYMLPDIKNIIVEREKIAEEYEKKLKNIEEKIELKKEGNKFLYDIISSSGTGDKLVESIIKCLRYIGYEKIEDWDKIRKDNDKEEDLHIYKNEKEYFIAEVKGINGPAIEDDCNVIVKYKSRNCSKLNVSTIHGIVFMNYHKNVEPNQREELGFTNKEIKDAIRDKYTLVGTYQLFKAIRLYQEKIISSESIRKSLETPGIFRAIPETFEEIGKIEDILDRINVICVPIKCNKLKVNDELLIIEGNNYYRTKILSIMVNENSIKEAKKGDETGIKIDKDVPKIKSAQIYLIK
ncbi:MAG: hypothetical protein ACLVAK_03075 [Clostridia bacterium]|jgi:hypothetical protein